mgnify:CR=1 FL=1
MKPDPSDDEVVEQLLAQASELGDAAGLDLCARALELQPRNACIWYLRSVLYNDMSLYDLALGTILKAIALEPDSAYFWFQKGIIYSNVRRYDRSLRALDRALCCDPSLEPAQSFRDFVKGNPPTRPRKQARTANKSEPK